MEYLVRFAQTHETFRRPEIEALASLVGVDVEFLFYDQYVCFFFFYCFLWGGRVELCFLFFWIAPLIFLSPRLFLFKARAYLTDIHSHPLPL